MLLPDVNVLVYAHREEVDDHERYRAWLLDLVSGPRPYAMAELVLSGFIRIVTHPRIFKDPTPPEQALAFADELRQRENCTVVSPGGRHWGIFLDLCRDSGARGNLVPDAYLAALAIESGCEWVTTDKDFGKFSGLRWRRPVE